MKKLILLVALCGCSNNNQYYFIVIEHEKGSIRSGIGQDGPWSTKMESHYGYILATKGTDDECVDVYIGDDTSSIWVFLVYQVHPKTGGFDEYKAMLGFSTKEKAKQAYLKHMPEKYLGFIMTMTIEEFGQWLKAK